MLVLSADLVFAGNHDNQMLVSMWAPGEDLGFARVHHTKMVVSMWVLGANIPLQPNSGYHVGTACKLRLCRKIIINTTK